MKIGIISTTGGYEWAGSEELWYLSALEALSKGNKVTAIVAAEMLKSKQVLLLIERGGHILPRRKIIHPRLSLLKEKFISSYSSMMSDQDITVVSAGSVLDIVFLPGLYKALKDSKKPVIILLQFNAEILALSLNVRAVIKDIMQFARLKVFVSHHNRSLVERQIASALTNTEVVYNPIKVTLSAPLPFPVTSVVNFACVARLETLWKGHDVLLEVLGQSIWQKRNWHLNIYGVGPDQQYINDLIEFYKLNNRVTLHGHISNVVDIWKTNSLLLLPSRGEGTPLAILECMMCGRPVVTTDVGGNREVITENVNGWIAHAATSYSFGLALENAWNSRSLFQEMGIKAHEASKKFADQNPAKALLEAIYATASS